MKSLLLSLTALLVLPLTAEDFTPDRSVVYKEVDGLKLKLEVFEPEDLQPDDERPAIVFFFGGGWSGGSPKQFYPHARELAGHGLVAFSANYRVKSRHQTTPFEAVEDAKSALRWLRQNADTLGIDPDRIVASGGSAGGHLAACTGVISGYTVPGEDQAGSSRANALILFNPVLDTSRETGFAPDRFGAGREKVLSPIHHLTPNEEPPTLIFHGTADRTVPFEQAERFTAAMQKKGNDCTLIASEGAGHGFFNHGFYRPGNADAPFYRDTMDASLRFLRKLGYLAE
ncbi:alpha/beta hydrolase [Roseibacillus ishigakijimensis]|uniref:Alpha/beta hydrolase n=1 Tax=Roseibacillus ishigakijimensis TaxID=454146 RepID=A0A934RPN5_9BACT|nr:alpha/beta hydrolase [Roseibacillus ishigakijimensis]MBK1833547.1 alpha/beta hydrolase [Roseibacillus ishigakijimensis]